MMNTDFSNTLSLADHIERIKETQKNLRDNFLQLADQIREACEQLEGDTQYALSQELGMSQSNVAKWLRVGKNEIFRRYPQSLPPSLSTLYELTVLNKSYLDYYGPKDGEKRFVKLFEKGEITENSSRSDVGVMTKEIRALQKLRSNTDHQTKIEATFTDKPLPASPTKSITDLLQSRVRYHTFVVIPTEKMMGRWRKLELASYIHDEFPLADLRKTTHKSTVHCLLQIQLKDIETGLRCLNAWGFTHRDTLVPHQPSKAYVSMNDEIVYLRGQRGRQDKKHESWLAKNIPSKQKSKVELKSSKLSDVLNYASQIGVEPFLLVGAETKDKNWVMCNE